MAPTCALTCLVITMIKWIWTSGLSIKDFLYWCIAGTRAAQARAGREPPSGRRTTSRVSIQNSVPVRNERTRFEVIITCSLSVHRRGAGGSSKSATAEGEGFDGSNLRVQLRALVDIPEGDEFRM